MPEAVQNLKAYHLIQWAFKEHGGSDDVLDDTVEVPNNTAVRTLPERLTAMLTADNSIISEESTPARARVAYALIILNMSFGRAYERILLVLLNSLNSEQATVRSKGLKSVVQLIERDPTILDRGSYVIQYIVNRASDPSPLVRDSALGLLAKCLTLRSSLEQVLLKPVLARAVDAQVGVRKRSMKILKDMLQRSTDGVVQGDIAEALLRRVADADEGVSELAIRLMEEAWISPLLNTAEGDNDIHHPHPLLVTKASLMVSAMYQTRGASTALKLLLQTTMSEGCKNAKANTRVYQQVVEVIFDQLIDSEDQPECMLKHALMHALTIFAQVKPLLFRAEQLEHLLISIEHLTPDDDLYMFTSVVIVYRSVLPHILHVKATFLTAVQTALLASLTKLSKYELCEVVPCLGTISRTLNATECLSNATISCIAPIFANRNKDFQPDSQKRLLTNIVRYINVAALFGRHVDFGSDLERFRKRFFWWKGDSIPALLADAFIPYTSADQPSALRAAAIDGYITVCQKDPKLFLREKALTKFDMVLVERDLVLGSLVLAGFKDFLMLGEKRPSDGAERPGSHTAEPDPDRLANGIVVGQHDGVTTTLAQRYLHLVVQIALTSQEAHGLLATELVAAINRQGLVHPKECVCALVVLTTSRNPAIAKIAVREHRLLHQKHETIVEKEYMKAVQQTFVYQKEIVRDSRGADPATFTSKLQPLYEAVKTSKIKLRRKFFASLCGKVAFDFHAPTEDMNMIPHLEFSRFVLESLAYLDYGTVDELLQVIFCLEKVVSATGATVAHALETELFMRDLPRTAECAHANAQLQPQQVSQDQDVVSLPRLRIFAASCMILSLAWDARTYLRRAYGLTSSSPNHHAKTKSAVKDLNKPPTRIQGIIGQSFWEQIDQRMASLATPADMTLECRQLVDLMTIDHELQIAAENDDDAANADRPSTPSENRSSTPPAPPSGSGRGRKRKTAAGRTSGQRTKKPRGSAAAPKTGSTAPDDDYV
ncbi:MAG: Sister chromatid cohesion protein 2 [Phylliscum demangeonii]|nr:MAG: Sister chromatid cohesion protein 2 [Phylliscum demangeonii]